MDRFDGFITISNLGFCAGDLMTTEPTLPELGATGLLRFMWRQLTSMRTALILLMMLGVAAIPGSFIPQRAQNPMAILH